jgi:hypothetical protein
MFPLAQEQVDRVLDSYNYEFKDGEIRKQFRLPDYFSYADANNTNRYYIEVLKVDGDIIECVKYSCNYRKNDVHIERTYIAKDTLEKCYKSNNGEEWDGEEESLIDWYVRD